MDLTPMLRQTVSWEVKTGTNSRSDASYAAPAMIPARCVPKYRDIILATGENVTTSQMVLTIEAPAIGDLINGREVIQVDGLVDYAGNPTGFSSLTR